MADLFIWQAAGRLQLPQDFRFLLASAGKAIEQKTTVAVVGVKSSFVLPAIQALKAS